MLLDNSSFEPEISVEQTLQCAIYLSVISSGNIKYPESNIRTCELCFSHGRVGKVKRLLHLVCPVILIFSNSGPQLHELLFRVRIGVCSLGVDGIILSCEFIFLFAHITCIYAFNAFIHNTIIF